jgi:hypothetical protein
MRDPPRATAGLGEGSGDAHNDGVVRHGGVSAARAFRP